MRHFLGVVGVLTFSATVACGGESTDSGFRDDAPDQIASTGAQLYRAPHSDGNTFACASCHALAEPAADGIRRVGHAIGDAAGRPSFKNGQLTRLLDAVNVCRTEWMGAPAWTADDQDWVTLESFLVEQAGGERAPELSYEVVAPLAQTDGGDAMLGQTLFNQSCVACHGQDATGTERAPPLVGALLTADQIARRVRTSGLQSSTVYAGLTGGRMPFWAADRISDDELRNVIAFVLANDPRDGGERDDGESEGQDGLRACPTTHAKVGQVATLSRFAHQVGGTATIVDDCTIRVDNFTFDGQGIDVRFYSGLGGDYDRGFSMSERDLRRNTAYQGETVFAQLPEGRTLDELDGISVWCVPAAVSFGDGLFGTP